MTCYKVGDSVNAICEHCEKIVKATFEIRDVPLSNSDSVVKDVLVGICDCCNQICVITHYASFSNNDDI